MAIDISSIGPAPDVGGTDDTGKLMEQQKLMSLWMLKVSTISNCLKTESEGNIAIARNMK